MRRCILTVHGSKGWSSRSPSCAASTALRAAAPRKCRCPSGRAVADPAHARRVAAEGFDANRAIDEQMDEHERIRLLFTWLHPGAETISSCHCTEWMTSARPALQPLAGRVTSSEDAATLTGIQTEQPSGGPIEPDSSSAPGPLPPMAVRISPAGERSGRGWWRRLAYPVRSATGPAAHRVCAIWELATERMIARAMARTTTGSSSRRVLLAADDGEPGLAKRPVDLDLPAWRKGRYGTAGRPRRPRRAPGGGPGVRGRDRGVGQGPGHRRRDRRRARPRRPAGPVRPLRPRVCRRAAGSEHWREVYVGVPFAGRDGSVAVLEGYIDLLYRRADGLVVVDHKTDVVATDGSAGGQARRLPAPARRPTRWPSSGRPGRPWPTCGSSSVDRRENRTNR